MGNGKKNNINTCCRFLILLLKAPKRFSLCYTLSVSFSIVYIFLDDTLASSQGLRKPDPRIYMRVIEKLQERQILVHPSECVYLDDLISNLAPAKQLGMHVIEHWAEVISF